ncbi:MBL fold metallo-hydrolase [Trinickia mobilis]|uniref:MBL fold metallo-hydrolase n=1 Tax=Trinickia mobilis TaxID=2816356 RepID=UPI001A8C52EF|nr:MBL fold metallo-hydrolase [Trinickia mobilis]
MFPHVESFYDPSTGTVSHIVYAGYGAQCAVIDPVLDFDAASGRTSTHSLERLIAFVEERRLEVQWILETHAHADHLSGASALKRRVGGKIGIGRSIVDVRSMFSATFDLTGEHGFDHLFAPDEVFAIGTLQAQVLATPGHTPADVAFMIEDALFVGDTLFMPDVGTARCDFPGGNARLLYASIRRLLALPKAMRVFVCHDYPPHGREARFWTTVGEQRKFNVHVRDGICESDFVERRMARDSTLKMPVLLFPAMQVNLRGGRLPAPDANGLRYLKTPIDDMRFAQKLP